MVFSGFKIILWFAYLLLLLEGATRIYWSTHNLPWNSDVTNLYQYYFPELKKIEPPKLGQKRVLLLGGSVLAFSHRAIERKLNLTGQDFVVYNLAKPARTSRESLIKYRLLHSEQFDLVIFYHGINEVRANNIRPESFRANYSHYRLYEQVDVLERYESYPYFLMPVTIHLAYVVLKQQIFEQDYIPKGPLHKDRLHFGSDIKTKAPFRSNIERIIELAQGRGETFALMTFASYQPDNYSRSGVENGELDYHVGRSKPVATELWGKPENVLLGIEEHNKVIRQVVKSFEGKILFVDQEVLIPARGDFFVDICHLSPVGIEKFVDNLMTTLQPQFLPK